MKSPAGILIRNDLMGSGYFGTPRGKRTHVGVDLAVLPGTPIHAPEKCTVERLGVCYGNDPDFDLVLVSSMAFKHKILYVNPCVESGMRLEEGDLIGHSQNVQDRHGIKMIPHIHWEIFVAALLDNDVPAHENIISYVWINPMNLLGLR